MEDAIIVFNNYYFSLLKKLKDIARIDKNREAHRSCISAIKAHYQSYDKSSDEYLAYYRGVCDSPLFDTIEQGKEWLDGHSDIRIYKDITVKLSREILGDDNMYLYFLVGLHVAAHDIDLKRFTEIAQNIKDTEAFGKCLDELDAEQQSVLRKQLTLMGSLYRASMKSGIDEGMADIENTSLGKLAKEIMNEVDVSKLTETLDSDGDILKTLGNPDSGLTKLLGTVSQKLISKMASGEINNETLIKDALEFSSKMGGRGGMAGMPDMSGMMSMFQGMMKGEAGDRAAPRAPKGYAVDRSAVSRVAKAKQLKRKLDEKRKKAKENVGDV